MGLLLNLYNQTNNVQTFPPIIFIHRKDILLIMDHLPQVPENLVGMFNRRSSMKLKVNV